MGSFRDSPRMYLIITPFPYREERKVFDSLPNHVFGMEIYVAKGQGRCQIKKKNTTSFMNYPV